MPRWHQIRRSTADAARSTARTAARLLAPFGLDDLLAGAGIAMLGHGVAMIAPWAAWSVCGLIVFWLGVRR